MKITIFGANGKVGKSLVEDVLDEGHEVVAFVHSHHELATRQGLTIIQGDVHRVEDVERALLGSDAVMSALGSWGTKTKDVLSSAMSTIIPIMQKHTISRIISLTGAEARAKGDNLGFIHRVAHALAHIFTGKILRDGEEHIALLEKSNLDWTVIRSPIMKSKKGGVFSLTDDRPLPWMSISRDAVVEAMVNELSEPHSQQAPFVR